MNPSSEPHPIGSAAPEAAYLDGNAAAGPLRQLFAVDVTAAVGQCAGCGRSAVLAEARLHAPAPGLVLRCAGCDGVLLRLVTAPDRAWLDLRAWSACRSRCDGKAGRGYARRRQR